jgi:hypothetical protein
METNVGIVSFRSVATTLIYTTRQPSYQELEAVAVRLKTVSNLIDAMMTAATPRLQNELAAVEILLFTLQTKPLIRLFFRSSMHLGLN